MRRFMANGRAPLLAVLIAVCAAGAGCFCYAKPPAESLLIDQAPEPLDAGDVYKPIDIDTSGRPVPKPAEEKPVPPPPVPGAVEAAIVDLAQKYPGLFVFDPATGMLRFNSDITFDSGSNVVKPGARAALGQLAQILSSEQGRERRMTIIGHTDADRVRKAETVARLKGLGKPPTNQGLSEARAEAVAEVLVAGGIDAARITTRGQGESKPIAENRTPAGKASNRRVEIYLSPAAGAAAGGMVPAGRVNFDSGM
ncbi:MAG: OmpA family protein [Planctomycetes bacterium]|nr:OmpA family protein [Planctomycetota bacterium]